MNWLEKLPRVSRASPLHFRSVSSALCSELDLDRPVLAKFLSGVIEKQPELLRTVLYQYSKRLEKEKKTRKETGKSLFPLFVLQAPGNVVQSARHGHVRIAYPQLRRRLDSDEQIPFFLPVLVEESLLANAAKETGTGT